MSYRDFINWLSSTPAGGVLVRAYASRLDPILYKMSGGRLTSVGPQVIPQLVLTTTGRKASNLGGTNHPAWSYNLDANPRAKIQLGSEKRDIVATRLTDSEKAILWPKIADTLPQMKTYVKRTERNIKVYRLTAA